jgi:hypothetical protein
LLLSWRWSTSFRVAERSKKHLTEKKKLEESKNIIAIISIAVGVVVFTYQGITYTIREKVINCPTAAA